MNAEAGTLPKEINQQQQSQSNPGNLSLTMAEALSVDENIRPLQGTDEKELVVVLPNGGNNVRLENVTLNEVKEQQDQVLLDEDINCMRKVRDSLPLSKEWTPHEIDSSQNLHQKANLPAESSGASGQEFKEVLPINEQSINQNGLEIPEREKKGSMNLEMDHHQHCVQQLEGNEIEKKEMEQNQEALSPSLTYLKKINVQNSPKSAEMQCSLQQKSNIINVSKVKEQGKQMENQQLKKQKTGVVGDNHERINYLVQVSRTLVAMGQSEDKPTALNFDKPLASQTGSLATAVGRKSLVRLSPSLKRVLCKGCGTMLIYGVNARVRQRSNRQRHLVITCLVCNTIRRLVCDNGHKLWCEQREAVV